MIAELRITRMGRTTRVFLDDDCRWLCETDRSLAALLNAAHPIEVGQLDVHRPAVHECYQVAARLGAEVFQPPFDDLPPLPSATH